MIATCIIDITTVHFLLLCFMSRTSYTHPSSLHCTALYQCAPEVLSSSTWLFDPTSFVFLFSRIPSRAVPSLPREMNHFIKYLVSAVTDRVFVDFHSSRVSLMSQFRSFVLLL